MKILKLTAAGLFTLFGIIQFVLIIPILSMLFSGKAGEGIYYLVGRLGGHLIVILIALLIAYKLFISTKKLHDR